ncbi:MAG: adenylosuccinate lyase, partial [Clostridiales bacterium]|nr:adenylosuccinate lyase [Clostridiales bacterium]
LSRIAADPEFGVTFEELQKIVSPEKYVGRAPQQTEEFIAEVVNPLMQKYDFVSEEKPEINL